MTEKHEYYPDSSLFSASLEKVMGTRFFILLLGKEERQASELWEEVRSLLESGDSVFNRFSSESEVSKVNALLKERGEALLSDVLARSVADCVEFRRRTSGLFDITKDSKKELAIEGNVLRAEGAELDFGGYAKGWALRQIMSLLESKGVSAAFVDFGGSSICALGSHPAGDCWSVDLNSPRTGMYLNTFRLRDSSLSTSGNTPAYSGHIVNPITGEANKRNMMVLVEGKDPLVCEVLSTAYMLCHSEELREGMRREFGDYVFNAYSDLL